MEQTQYALALVILVKGVTNQNKTVQLTVILTDRADVLLPAIPQHKALALLLVSLPVMVVITLVMDCMRQGKDV